MTCTLVALLKSKALYNRKRIFQADDSENAFHLFCSRLIVTCNNIRQYFCIERYRSTVSELYMRQFECKLVSTKNFQWKTKEKDPKYPQLKGGLKTSFESSSIFILLDWPQIRIFAMYRFPKRYIPSLIDPKDFLLISEFSRAWNAPWCDRFLDRAISTNGKSWGKTFGKTLSYRVLFLFWSHP